MKRDSFKTLLLAFIFLLFIAPSRAQTSKKGNDVQKSFSQYSIDIWNNENGLPGNAIKDIIKTADGYIWFATLDGLARFDGVKFDTYDKETSQSFKTNAVLSLFEDKQENLWIGTKGNGVLRLNNGKFDAIQTSKHLKNVFVTSFAQTTDSMIWVGTNNGLAQIVNNQLVSLKNFPSLRNISINKILVDSKNNLWIATKNAGLIKKTGDYIKQYTTADGIISNSIRRVFEDSKNNIWLGTDDGLMVIQDGYRFVNMSKKHNLPNGFVNTIFEDNKNNIIVGTNYGLVWFYDGGLKIYDREDGLPNNIVTTILGDGAGGIWIGTYKGGVIRLKDGLFLNYGVKEGLSNNFVNVIYETDSTYYIGTEEGISVVKDGIFKNYKIYNSPLQNRVKAFLKDRKNNLWVGTYNGLYKFNNGLKKAFSIENGLSNNQIRCIAEDNQDRLWLGTANGINIIDKHKKITFLDEKSGLLNTFIMCLFKDQNGSMLIGTNGKGFSIYKNGKIQTFTKEEGLCGNVIFNIFQEKSGLIWLSTDNGICSYDGKSFTTFHAANKIFQKAVFQVLKDKNDKIWVTTSEGIYVVDKKYLLASSEKQIDLVSKIKLYDRVYGLRSMGVSGGAIGLMDSKEKIWFPTWKGVAIIDTKAMKINLKSPKVAIEKIVLGKNELLPFQDIKVKAGNNNIQIHYTGLNFFAPQKIKFRYQLENFDKEWVQAGERRIAYYNNLPPGKYTFKVQAANDDGVWNDSFKSIKLIKEAYYYQENWFKALTGLFLLALAVALYMYQVWGFKRKNEQLAKQVSERTKDINTQKEELEKINASKDKLLSIISHDLKGPLKSIRQILKFMSSGHVSQDEFKLLTNNLQQDVGSSVNLLDNLLHWSKSQMHGIKVAKVEIDLHQIVDENFKLFQSTLNNNEINYTNEIPVGEVALADFDMIKLVIRNLIANAIKFTPQGGKIKVSSAPNGDLLEISVADTGIGMTNMEKARIFEVKESFTKIAKRSESGTGLGLILCKEFIEKNGGTIWVESKKGKGSTFTFTVKLVN